MLFTDQGNIKNIYNIYWKILLLTETIIPSQAWQQASPACISSACIPPLTYVFAEVFKFFMITISSSFHICPSLIPPLCAFSEHFVVNIKIFFFIKVRSGARSEAPVVLISQVFIRSRGSRPPHLCSRKALEVFPNIIHIYSSLGREESKYELHGRDPTKCT